MSDAPVYLPRTKHLPDREQTYLHLPGVRPDRGPCPECGAPEDVYCDQDCNLADPYAKSNVASMIPCVRCAMVEKPAVFVHNPRDVLVLPNRSVKHVTLDRQRSICGTASRPKAIMYRFSQW